MSNQSSFGIFGAGAHGRVVRDLLRARNREARITFIDDNPALVGGSVQDVAVIGRAEASRMPNLLMLVALGKPSLRLSVAAELQELGLKFGCAIHPTAVIADSAVVGAGCMIGAMAVVNSDAHVGDHIILNTGAIVEHDAVLEDGATICPGASIGGRAVIRRKAFVSTGAIILPRVQLGAGSVVAAGAVVVDSVPDQALVMGIPARTVGNVGEEYPWERLL